MVAEVGRHHVVEGVVRRLRSRLSDRHTLTIDALDSTRYEEFLVEEVRDLKSLVHERNEKLDLDDKPIRVLGWNACRWKDHYLELVLPPGEEAETIIAIGASAEVLREFASVLREYCDRTEGRASAFTYGGWDSDIELDREIAKTSWDEVVLPSEQIQAVRAASESFFARRDVYHNLGVAWRRGVLLAGPPGTGKTMICKVVADSLPETPFLYVRDFSGRKPDEEQIYDVFEYARKRTPAILVFEDIDGFVHDANRAVFLNELDGFRDNDGLLVLGSTNHPERVDEALLKRPSRFDRVFHIGLPAEADRREYCRRFLARSGFAGSLTSDLDVEDLCAKVAARTGGFTPAHLKEALVSAALEQAHSGAPKLNSEYAASVLSQVDALKSYMKDSRNPGKLADSSEVPERRLGFKTTGE
jgi:hypothetical protein